METPYERIARARSLLVDAGLSPDDAALDAEVLARHALQWDRARLLAHGRDPSPAGFQERFDELVARRLRREPVAQIVGRREFWGLEMEVTRDVLIPRPETELIVEEALAVAAERACRSIVDVGTGTGCIAIAIAHELPEARVLAIDMSEAALQVAQRNASRHGVADRVSFQRADLLAGVSERADLIVSNPPYVRDLDRPALQPEVATFEPHAALFGGPDGLTIIRRLLAEAPSRLAPGGTLILEFGLGQEDEVAEAARAAGWSLVRTRSDLQGIARTLVLTHGAGVNPR